MMVAVFLKEFATFKGILIFFLNRFWFALSIMFGHSFDDFTLFRPIVRVQGRRSIRSFSLTLQLNRIGYS
jgi:hypothetical protein